jgi:hypothetical protein
LTSEDPSKKVWRKRLDELLTEAGLPTMQGHTVRIGGATQLLLHGVKPLVVKVMGRWSSDAFQTYWRNIAVILAKFATSATVRTALVEEQSLSSEDLRMELRAVHFSSVLSCPSSLWTLEHRGLALQKLTHPHPQLAGIGGAQSFNGEDVPVEE